jgi:hypothetical protein
VDCFLLLGGGGWCCCGAATHASRSVEACIRRPPSSTSSSTLDLSRPVLPRQLWRVVGWVGFLSDVIGGVESVLWEGWYPALTLAHGVCVIVYVEADVDEGGLRLQASTDCVACAAAPQQHQSPPPATRLNPQGAASQHGEGGQRQLRTAATCHTAGCGSNLPLHHVMQQRCHHTSASARKPVLAAHTPSPPAAGSHCPAREGSAPH